MFWVPTGKAGCVLSVFLRGSSIRTIASPGEGAVRGHVERDSHQC